LRAKRVPVRAKKARFFNCLARIPTQNETRFAERARRSRAGNGSFTAEGAEVKVGIRAHCVVPANAGTHNH